MFQRSRCYLLSLRRRRQHEALEDLRCRLSIGDQMGTPLAVTDCQVLQAASEELFSTPSNIEAYVSFVFKNSNLWLYGFTVLNPLVIEALARHPSPWSLAYNLRLVRLSGYHALPSSMFLLGILTNLVRNPASRPTIPWLEDWYAFALTDDSSSYAPEVLFYSSLLHTLKSKCDYTPGPRVQTQLSTIAARFAEPPYSPTNAYHGTYIRICALAAALQANDLLSPIERERVYTHTTALDRALSPTICAASPNPISFHMQADVLSNYGPKLSPTHLNSTTTPSPRIIYLSMAPKAPQACTL